MSDARPLYIGIDREKIVVAPTPLTVRPGRSRRRRRGSVTEVVPVPASGRSRADRARFAGQLTLVLLFLSGLLNAGGVAWWPVLGASALIVTAFAAGQARAARTGLIVVPPGDRRHVMSTTEERAAYGKALAVAQRIRAAAPELSDMIDPADADRALTRALDDLAAVLSRRQELRRLRVELTEVDHRDLPADSPAVRALTEQRARVNVLFREAGMTANRLLNSLRAAAVASENLIREQRIGATAERAERALAQLTAAGASRSLDAGPELAERTAAVIAAYRELGSGL
jgi:hypothetical protein